MSLPEEQPETADLMAREQAARPAGVATLAALHAAVAVFGIVFSGFAFVGAVGSAAFGAPWLAGVAIVFAIFWLIVATAAAAIAMGLWSRRRWAWYAALVLAGAAAFLAVLALLVGDVGDGILWLLFAGLVVWILLRPATQIYFGVGEERGGPAGRPV